MGKTTNITVKVDSELKRQAEEILSQSGIPLSNAINIFLKQVVAQKGLPFDIKFPFSQTIEVSSLTETKFNSELEKGFSIFAQGNPDKDEKIILDKKK